MEIQESATFFLDQYQSMQENQESKFVCKLCNKKYPCGKSLGAHMRSHVIAADCAESEEKVELKMRMMSSLLNGGANISKKEAKVDEFGGQGSQGNYGLRENPRKTWRAVDQSCYLSKEKVCKQCGKVFQSLKALCGHMACHSEKEKGGGNKDDSSWTSGENQKLVLDSHADTETEEGKKLRSKRNKRLIIKNSSSVSGIEERAKVKAAVTLMMLSRDSRSNGGLYSVVESSDNNSVVLETKSLSSTEIITDKRDGLIVEKMGDMKLKKNDSSEMLQPESSESGYYLGDATGGELEVSVNQIRGSAAYWECVNSSKCQRVKSNRTELRKEPTKENGFGNGAMELNKESKKRKKADNIWDEAEEDDDELVAESYKKKKHENGAEVFNTDCKRSKYECFNCKKSFKSFQALGGHRPCHKRTNACSQLKYENGENSLDADNDGDEQPFGNKKGKLEKKSNKSKKQKGHACPFCERVFKSGQALGGHKRSHFLGGGGNEVIRDHQSPEINEPEVHDLFDLNLPAPVEDEDDIGNVQFPSW